MTREEIIALAREAGMTPNHMCSDWECGQSDLERFAALVAAREREECAKVVQANAEACDTYSTARSILESNAAAIRARGKKGRVEP